MKTTLVALLLRLYPKAWRNEYGAELADVLRARPLTLSICGNVVASAIWQRIRGVQAPTWVGLGLMLAMTGAVAATQHPAHLERRARARREPGRRHCRHAFLGTDRGTLRVRP